MSQVTQRDGQAPAPLPVQAARVLLIDDDRELCSSLARLLHLEGFEVTAVHSAQHAVTHATNGRHALILLDVMLPGGDGRLILRKIRTVSDIPVLMLTARGDEMDRIAGLEAGADDYLAKPFHVRELVARMRSVLRRRSDEAVRPLSVRVDDLEVMPKSRRVVQAGREVSLTGAEFEILLLLLRSEGKVIARDEIAEVCLGRPVGVFDRSVDNHISNLRRKLGAAVDGTERIRSLRGTGYVYTGAGAGTGA